MFSDILKNLRAEAHISQGKLAESIGVSAGNVSTWEGGESKPGYVALCSLARFFGVSADYLLELSPKKEGDTEADLHFLEDVKKKEGLLCDGSPLTSVETDLIAMFRLLPSLEQEDIFDLVHLKYKKRVERKKSSIYWTYFAESSGEESDPAEGREANSGTA